MLGFPPSHIPPVLLASSGLMQFHFTSVSLTASRLHAEQCMPRHAWPCPAWLCSAMSSTQAPRLKWTLRGMVQRCWNPQMKEHRSTVEIPYPAGWLTAICIPVVRAQDTTELCFQLWQSLFLTQLHLLSTQLHDHEPASTSTYHKALPSGTDAPRMEVGGRIS